MPDEKVVEGLTPEEQAAAQAAAVDKGKAAGAASPLDVVIDGDGVPEDLKGKTVKELMQMHRNSELEMAKAKTGVSQWNHWYSEMDRLGYWQLLSERAKDFKDKERASASVSPDDEEPTADGERPTPRRAAPAVDQRVIDEAVGRAVKPIVNTVSTILKRVVSEEYDDFDAHEKRASEVFNNLPLNMQADPAYGWRFAYHFAKSEEASKAPRKALPLMGPSATSGPQKSEVEELSDLEKDVAKKLGLTPQEYVKFKKVDAEV